MLLKLKSETSMQLAPEALQAFQRAATRALSEIRALLLVTNTTL